MALPTISNGEANSSVRGKINVALSAVRKVLTADTTYHVATTGNDTTGDGSSGAPWATLQFAVDWLVGNIDPQKYFVSIQLADGTYAGTQIFGAALFPLITIDGNAADNTKVILTDTWSNRLSAAYSCVDLFSFCPGLMLNNITFEVTQAGNSGITTSFANGSSVYLNNPYFKATGVTGWSCISVWSDNTTVNLARDPRGYSGLPGFFVEGNWGTCFNPFGQASSIHEGGNINTFTFVGTPFFNQAFYLFDGSFSALFLNGWTVVGSCTGHAYQMQNNFCILSVGTFPGDGGPGTLGALNFVGGGITGVSKSGLPTTADIGPSQFNVFKDTVSGGVSLAYNDAGTIKRVAGTANQVTAQTSITYVGSELVPDHDLSTDPALSGWTLGADSSWAAGTITTVNNTSSPSIQVPVTLVVGHTYLLDLHQTVLNDNRVAYGNGFFQQGYADYQLWFVATVSGPQTITIDFYNYIAGASATLTSVSCREIDTPLAALTVTNYAGTVVMTMGADSFHNVAIGEDALSSNTNGGVNIAVGFEALKANTSGYNNVAIGQAALLANTTGNRHVAIGLEALRSTTTAHCNIGIGQAVFGRATTGYCNIGMGPFAGYETTTGHDNIAIGEDSFYFNTTGYNNVVMGRTAFNSNITGHDNIGIGFQADINSGALFNAIVIGANAKVMDSNTVQIGDSNVRSINIGAPGSVASLPSPATVGAGARSCVTDSTVAWSSAAIGTIVAGGGANFNPVISDGVHWLISG